MVNIWIRLMSITYRILFMRLKLADIPRTIGVDSLNLEHNCILDAEALQPLLHFKNLRRV